MSQYQVSDRAKFDLTVIVLALLTAFGPLSIDMYLPAFGDIAADFGTPSNRVELSLTSFFLGLFIGQLLYGTASDRFGRKPPLYFGVTLFIVASFACAFAPNLETLIVLRFLQAVGSCAGLVIARAMVRDLYTPQASAQVFSFLILVMGVAPILAPLAGAYVTVAWGWPAIFLIIGAVGIACMATVHLRLPETHAPNPSIRIRDSLPIYWTVLRDPSFLRYSLSGGIAQAGMFAYITASPLVFIEHFGMSPTSYSWLFGMNAVGIIGLSQFNAWLLTRRESRKILNLSLPLLGVIAIVLIIAGWQGFGMIGVIIPLFLYVSTLGLVFPNAMAGALAEQQQRAGSASAVTGSLQFLIAGVMSAVVNVLGHYHPLAMVFVMGGCGLTAVLVYRLLRRE
ncbi:MFS transporter, DHA1 family, bicyclomycin/chloramphenicol resistance protein [Pseudidiomarina indica]|uniref:Bcr/CflA family efflux transporter n=1 Tax=Pseudidiomarina indica TaxID=1159017 RepID=A0A1G6AW07_9GAMM|nr:multidrug effflux MFS transporter [Pseudidiomarina indica]SDB12489.1 MFS transporter, DHA1 family, bicyclomycin/chloramphenicol resistance protein [Pseudidiomarina indica]